MSRRAAILGLGGRGRRWALGLRAAGWSVVGFDPDVSPGASGQPRRETTISATVRNADFVVVTVPDRLDLVQSVIRRAQAEAPKEAVVAVVSQAFDVDAVRTCALQASHVVLICESRAGVALSVSVQTPAPIKHTALSYLSELDGKIDAPAAPSQLPGAESA